MGLRNVNGRIVSCAAESRATIFRSTGPFQPRAEDLGHAFQPAELAAMTTRDG